MTDDAKMSMILCSDLEPAEQEKVQRLDWEISENFTRAGHVVRLCRGRVDGDSRMLDFCTGLPGTTVIAVPASKFLAASDAKTLVMLSQIVSDT